TRRCEHLWGSTASDHLTHSSTGALDWCLGLVCRSPRSPAAATAGIEHGIRMVTSSNKTITDILM
ncbi:MAG: hypothetical protein LC749_21495, partial [Actinobacteria bacterium]|nr:hypothetical protein [Actinomycetota bacterium]